DNENKSIDLIARKEGIIPFYGEVQGVLKVENRKIQMKFLHFNDLFIQIKDTPMLQIDNLFTSDVNRLNREAVKDSSNLLAVATQRNTSVYHIIPLYFK